MFDSIFCVYVLLKIGLAWVVGSGLVVEEFCEDLGVVVVVDVVVLVVVVVLFSSSSYSYMFDQEI